MNKLLAAAVAMGMVATMPFGAGVAAAETALIVSGTATPTGPAANLYHFKPEMVPLIGAKYYDSATATREQVPYPGTVRPLTGANSPTLAQSVATGNNNLDAMIRRTDGPIVVPGLSQGTLVLDAEQARLANDPTAPPPDQLTFMKFSDPSPLLNKFAKPGEVVPVLEYTMPQPFESQYNTVNVVSQYDIYSDPPERMGNLLAVANALVGRGHTLAAFTDPAAVPPQNVTVTTNSKGATTTTYFLPQEELPLVTTLRNAGVPDPVANDLQVVMKPMIDRAYGPPPPPLPGVQPPNLGNLPNLGDIRDITIPITAVNGSLTAANGTLAAANTARTLNNVRNILVGRKNK